mgnify:CR=1 FL=1|tara:strand:- start:6773 stop:7042 length:270 start_codon:yes stop_codon:yes gene_type:complete
MTDTQTTLVYALAQTIKTACDEQAESMAGTLADALNDNAEGKMKASISLDFSLMNGALNTKAVMSYSRKISNDPSEESVDLNQLTLPIE